MRETRLTLLARGDDARASRWVVGTRAAALLGDAGEKIESVYAAPGSVPRVTSIVQQLALDLDAWVTKRGSYELWLFHHAVRPGAGYGPVDRRVVPAAPAWLHELGHRRWSTSQLPMCGGNSHAVYSALVQQYLFVSLHQAMLESMLCENIARLAAMQTAERNIEDRCAALQFEYQPEPAKRDHGRTAGDQVRVRGIDQAEGCTPLFIVTPRRQWSRYPGGRCRPVE